MFEHTLTENRGRSASRWALVLSTGIQCLLVGGLLLVPLLNYYELPLTGFVSFLAAPPPPPPARRAEVMPTKSVPREFDKGTLVQPATVPESVAIIDEGPPQPASGIAGIEGGVPSVDSSGGLGVVIGGVISWKPDRTRLPPPPVVEQKVPPTRIRVGGNVARARLTRQVRPKYPALARQARIQGTVVLAAVISKDGSIHKLEVQSGHPLLVPEALAAVKQWRYKPTLLNGEPVEVLTSVTVTFTLSG